MHQEKQWNRIPNNADDPSHVVTMTTSIYHDSWISYKQRLLVTQNVSLIK